MAIEQSISPIFNFGDSDVTIESCDGVHFLLHRKNLETHSEVFPGGEIHTEGEVVRLEERTSILEILFQFIYPRKQPELDSLSPEVLLEIAEAVQKYRIFSAMYVCGSRLRDITSTHALKVFCHAAKHHGNYSNALINEASLKVARTRPIQCILKDFIKEGLHPRFYIAWAEYEHKWDEIFDDLHKVVRIKASRSLSCDLPNYCCDACALRLEFWIEELRKAKGVEDLLAALAQPNLAHACSGRYCQTCSHPGACVHLTALVASCCEKLESLPKLADLLDSASASSKGS